MNTQWNKQMASRRKFFRRSASPGKWALVALLLTALAFTALDPQTVHTKNIELTRAWGTTMLVWGGANMLASGIGFFLTKDDDRYFHLGNSGWGGINLTLGLVGMVAAKKSREKVDLTGKQVYKTSQSLLKLFSLNLTLDGIYSLVGAVFYVVGQREDWPVLRGLGIADMVGGSGLFLIDVLFLALVKRHGNAVWEKIEIASWGGSGLAIRF